MRRIGIAVFAVLAFVLAPLAPAFAVALTITAANVAWVSGPVNDGQVAGEAFIAGALVYLSATGTWLKAQDDGTAVEAGSLGIGVALSTADAANARVSIARPGAIISVGTGTAGTSYGLCDAAGGICPSTDPATTDKVTFVALGIGSNKLSLGYLYDPGSVIP